MTPTPGSCALNHYFGSPMKILGAGAPDEAFPGGSWASGLCKGALSSHRSPLSLPPCPCAGTWRLWNSQSCKSEGKSRGEGTVDRLGGTAWLSPHHRHLLSKHLSSTCWAPGSVLRVLEMNKPRAPFHTFSWGGSLPVAGPSLDPLILPSLLGAGGPVWVLNSCPGPRPSLPPRESPAPLGSPEVGCL